MGASMVKEPTNGKTTKISRGTKPAPRKVAKKAVKKKAARKK
jgi:hypothetical protein